MSFSRNKGMFLAVNVLILGVFNILAFVLPFVREGGFWTGYAFATLAIILTACVGLYAFGRPGMKSKVYGIPLFIMVWPYPIIQVVLSIVEMAIPGIPIRYEIALNAILFAVFLIGLIVINAGKEEIERLDAKVKQKVFFIKSLQGDVETLQSKTQDAVLKKKLKELSETIRYSDPMSSPQLEAIENKLANKVEELSSGMESDAKIAVTLCDEIQQLFAERNRKCKLLK